MMLPFHTSQDVVDGYVRNSDGSIDHATTRQLAKLLGRPTGPGEMSPAEARAMGGRESGGDKGGGRTDPKRRHLRAVA